MKAEILVFVQGSSRSWNGSPDLCINTVGEKPVILHTLEKAMQEFHGSTIKIIAPEFDRHGALSELLAHSDLSVDLHYSDNESPLKRMISAAAHASDNSYVIRIDGLHMFWMPEYAHSMLSIARAGDLDAIIMPACFPSQLGVDVYKLGSLRATLRDLEHLDEFERAKFSVHPKYWIFSQNKYKTEYYIPEILPSDRYLLECRELAKNIYREERLDHTEKSIRAADQISYHYILAREYLCVNDNVLDIACGRGFGSAILAEVCKSVVGGDLDGEVVRDAQGKYADITNLRFLCEDVSRMSFLNATFDVVVSFETIEHIEDIDRYCEEISRVLKPGGKLILSTPQNYLGHIPICSQHTREFSLDDLKLVLSTRFNIVKILGIKAGTIIYPNDEIGSNTFLVATRKNCESLE